MEMKIEEGKYYLTDTGEAVGPARRVEPGGSSVWARIACDGQIFAIEGVTPIEAFQTNLLGEVEQSEPRPWKDLTDEEKGELLLAHHEGKVIEYYNEVQEDWFEPLSGPPLFHPCEAYRIKPKPQRETVALYGDTFYDFSDVEGCCPEYRITFDLVEGVPDCSSIKMEEV